MNKLTLQSIVPGILVQDDTGTVYYVGNLNGDTVALFRKTDAKGNPSEKYTDSKHTLFANVYGVPITDELLIERLGFTPVDETKFAYTVYESVRRPNPETGIDETVKPATFWIIDIDDSGKRFTNFLTRGDQKIYLAEVSSVHEIQNFIFSLTGKFLYIKNYVANEKDSTK